MKKVIHKTVSLLLAILFLLSTVSWKVEKHYCMGRLMNVALFVDVADCGMNMADGLRDLGHNEMKNSCCDDVVSFIDGQADLHFNGLELHESQTYFLLPFAKTIQQLSTSYLEQIKLFEQYPPPILVKDIQLLDEVFLI